MAKFKTFCWNCGKGYWADETRRGKRAKCGCGETFVIRGWRGRPSSGFDPLERELLLAMEDDGDAETRSAPIYGTNRESRPSSVRIVLIGSTIGFVTVALTLAVMVAVQLRGRDGPQVATAYMPKPLRESEPPTTTGFEVPDEEDEPSESLSPPADDDGYWEALELVETLSCAEWHDLAYDKKAAIARVMRVLAAASIATSECEIDQEVLSNMEAWLNVRTLMPDCQHYKLVQLGDEFVKQHNGVLIDMSRRGNNDTENFFCLGGVVIVVRSDDYISMSIYEHDATIAQANVMTLENGGTKFRRLRMKPGVYYCSVRAQGDWILRVLNARGVERAQEILEKRK